MPKPRSKLLRAASRCTLYTKILAALLVLFISASFFAIFILGGETSTGTKATQPKLRLNVNAETIANAHTMPSKANPSPREQTLIPTVQTTPTSLLPLDILRDFTNATSFFDSPQASSLFLCTAQRGAGAHVRIASLRHLQETLSISHRWSGNVIVGMAANVDSRSLAIFLKSARSAISSAEIILLAKYPTMTNALLGKDSILLNLFRQNCAHVVEFQEKYLQPPFLRSYHPSSLRWIFYHRLFNNYDSLLAKTVRNVIHVDVRDVQFGADPFRHLAEPRASLDGRLKEKMRRMDQTLLYTKEILDGYDRSCKLNLTRIDMTTNRLLATLKQPSPSGCKVSTQADSQKQHLVMTFKEEESPKIADCTWNAGWVRDCFGQVLLDAISTSDVSCSGVILGTVPAILDYFRLFSDTLHGKGALSDRFPRCERNGVDQGIHNVLLHTGLVPGVKFHTSLTFPGVVSHMQSDLYATANSDEPPRVMDAQGVAVSIVHQYDRIDGLQRRFAKQYVDWMDVMDWHAGWASPSSQCAKYKRLVQLDLLKGVCDYGSFRALTPDMCCSQCQAKPGCGAFTFAGGVCWFKRCSLPQLAAIYTNFTMHVALKLPLDKYVAVADEYNTPLDSLVVTAISHDALALQSTVDHAELMLSLRIGYNRLQMPVKIGPSQETIDPKEMLRNYFAFLPVIEEEFRRVDETSKL